jgi:hypothetical protein
MASTLPNPLLAASSYSSSTLFSSESLNKGSGIQNAVGDVVGGLVSEGVQSVKDAIVGLGSGSGEGEVEGLGLDWVRNLLGAREWRVPLLEVDVRL